MAAVPAEAMQKILLEIEEKAAASQQQLQLVHTQVAMKDKDNRLLELTRKEISGLDSNTKVYEGVGKMFVVASRDDVSSRLDKELKTVKTDRENLEKRQHYLETTLKNARSSLEQFLGRAAGR